MLMNGKLLYSQGLSGVRQAGSDFGGDGGEGFAVDVDDDAGGGFVGLAAARHEGFNSVAKGGGIGIFREVSGRFRMEGSGSSPGGGEHGTVRGVVPQIPDEGVDACPQVDAECLFSYQFHTSGSCKGPPSEGQYKVGRPVRNISGLRYAGAVRKCGRGMRHGGIVRSAGEGICCSIVCHIDCRLSAH